MSSERSLSRTLPKAGMLVYKTLYAIKLMELSRLVPERPEEPEKLQQKVYPKRCFTNKDCIQDRGGGAHSICIKLISSDL